MYDCIFSEKTALLFNNDAMFTLLLILFHFSKKSFFCGTVHTVDHSTLSFVDFWRGPMKLAVYMQWQFLTHESHCGAVQSM